MSFDRTSRFLLLAVLVLAAIWWFSGRVSQTAQKRTFRATIMNADTTGLNAFTIVPAPYKGLPEMRFFKRAQVWKLAMGPDTTELENGEAEDVLAAISDMRVSRLIGEMDLVKDRYDLGDSTADQLVFQAAGREHRLLVGSTTQGEIPVTAVHPLDDNNAYEITGDLGAFADKSFGDHMPKQLITGDPANWRRLVFQFPGDTGYVMEQHDRRWSVEGVPLDSTRITKFLTSLARSRGQDVVDPADTLQAIPAFRLIVEDTTRSAPMVVVVYNLPGRFIVRSSLNPKTVMPFDGQSEVPRMFRPRTAFM